MSWASSQTVITEGLNFLRICPINVSSSNALASMGTTVNLLMLTKEGEEYANATPEPEYKEKMLTNNTKMRMQVTITTVDPSTGDTAAAGTASDSFEVTALLSKADKDSLVTSLRIADQLWAGVMGIGRTPDGSIAGFQHLIGKISGNLKEDRAGGEMTEITIKLTGGKAYTPLAAWSATYTTAMTASTITPVGESTAITIPTVTDFASLVNGKILRTAAT